MLCVTVCLCGFYVLSGLLCVEIFVWFAICVLCFVCRVWLDYWDDPSAEGYPRSLAYYGDRQHIKKRRHDMKNTRLSTS